MTPASKKTSRVAYLFPSSREKFLSGVQTGEAADTPLRGLNHMPEAEHVTVGEYGQSTVLSRFLTGIPRPIQAFFLIPRLLQYDFIIAQDNLLLGYIVSLCARICRLKTRWLYIAMTSSTLMKRHARHPARLFLLKKFWTSYARIICLSSEQREDFVRLGIPRTNLTRIPFGVDVRFFQPTDVSREEDLIVSVGRDTGRDYQTLFEALERISHPCVVVASHINIPPGMPVPANVSVLYDREYAGLRDLYAHARLVVIVSKDTTVPDGSDCSGQTVILEALAAGKTVIATHRSWITDYLIPDKDLVVVEPNDPQALAQAIDSLLHDAEKRKRLAQFGHDKVTAHYTTKTFAEALQRIMNSL